MDSKHYGVKQEGIKEADEVDHRVGHKDAEQYVVEQQEEKEGTHLEQEQLGIHRRKLF